MCYLVDEDVSSLMASEGCWRPIFCGRTWDRGGPCPLPYGRSTGNAIHFSRMASTIALAHHE